MIFYVDDCEQKIGYSFKNKNLLRQCFTHASYSHEHKNEPSNERLEFFGDAILEYCISEYLYEKYPDCDEGKLTKLRQDLVSGKPLAEAIKKFGLDEFILYGEGEKKNLSGNHAAACENLFEAIVAGIYTDEGGGLEAAKKFIFDKLLTDKKTEKKQSKTTVKAVKPVKNEKPVIEPKAKKDPKSALQEYVQKYKLGGVSYSEKSRKGPSHQPIFEMSVSVDGKELAVGEGKRKTEAEKSAAEKALKILGAKKKSTDKVKEKRISGL